MNGVQKDEQYLPLNRHPSHYPLFTPVLVISGLNESFHVVATSSRGTRQNFTRKGPYHLWVFIMGSLHWTSYRSDNIVVSTVKFLEWLLKTEEQHFPTWAIFVSTTSCPENRYIQQLLLTGWWARGCTRHTPGQLKFYCLWTESWLLESWSPHVFHKKF